MTAFARGLEHPRWLYVLPNGDVLVAETNAPPRPDDNKGLKGWFFKRYQKKAGGAVPSANRISLLRDADGDGVAETRSVLLANLNSPFGMALVGDTLYVANSDAIVRVPYRPGDTEIDAPPAKVVDLMEALKASLAAGQSQEDKDKAKEKQARPRGRRAAPLRKAG